MSYEITLLSPADLPSYKALIDEAFDGSQPIEVYRKYAASDVYKIWVVKEGDAIVGSVTTVEIPLFTFGFQPCLELFNVAVLEAAQRRGIGRALLEFVIDKAKADGYRSISLTCLRAADPARALYESVGFKQADSVKYAMYF